MKDWFKRLVGYPDFTHPMAVPVIALAPVPTPEPAKLSKTDREIRRFRLAAEQATDPEKRARHLAMLAHWEAVAALPPKPE